MARNIEDEVGQSLTRFYIVALIVVALLTLSGLFLIRKTISTLNHDGRVVNLAGRQRMLSQRLTKLAIVKSQNLPSADTAAMPILLETWKDCHFQLARRELKTETGVVKWKSNTLDMMFAELQPAFDSLYFYFQKLDIPEISAPERHHALNYILNHESGYLSRMNEIVYRFDHESYDRIKNLEKIEWILDIMTVFILLAEGLLIFRPVVNTTKRVVKKLAESEENLKLLNKEMIETQGDMIQLKEEKYRIRLTEERVRASALIEGQEEERKRFARELHDGIGQMLTGLKLHAEKLMDVQFHHEKHRVRFGQLVALIQDTIQSTREISFSLMPSVLEDFGLGSALRLLCQRTSESSGIPVRYIGMEGKLTLGPGTQTGLYRIVQEALHNAVKHAEASQIVVTVSEQSGIIRISVSDNGKGFEPEPLATRIHYYLDNNHNGVQNIRTRAMLLDGKVDIVSNPGEGTKISISVNAPSA